MWATATPCGWSLGASLRSRRKIESAAVRRVPRSCWRGRIAKVRLALGASEHVQVPGRQLTRLKNIMKKEKSARATSEEARIYGAGREAKLRGR